MITRLPFTRLALLLTAILVAVCWFPAHAWDAERGPTTMLAAFALGLLGALFGDRIRALVARRLEGIEGRGQAILAGMSARMFATLIGAVVVLLVGEFATSQFGVWLGIQYLLLLGLEVFVSVRELRQNPAGSSGGKPPTDVPQDSTFASKADAED